MLIWGKVYRQFIHTDICIYSLYNFFCNQHDSSPYDYTKLNLPRGQSSPGNLQSGQQASNAILQIPQLSSLATHLQVATAVQLK